MAGLYYNRTRYYSTTHQRFIGEDPLGFASGDANFYAYVGNAPTVFIDPFGQRSLADWLARRHERRTQR